MPDTTNSKRVKHTRELIQDAAMELLAEYGYKGTSVRKIASKVGIRESALYNHYTNKEAIFLSITSKIFTTPFSHENDQKIFYENAKKGKRFLQRFMTEFKLLSFDKNSEKLFRIMMIELMQNSSLRESFIKEFHEKNIKLLSSSFFIMMQEGLIRSSDPMVMANEFLAPFFYLRLQISLLKADGASTTPLSTQFEKHVDFFWESIAL
ncbi:MAG: TetR family transcriptional regulator [Helicobacteraceae bacterium 4484_230]|nr:MAG: TetR family transcriptional regulator [Helicobacteraceae bacterium 4484_230]